MQHIEHLLVRPFKPGPKSIDAAKQLFNSPGKFLLSAPSLLHIPARQRTPETALPELVFLGRSNAGKSTLLENLVTGPIQVRTSRKPGCTKLANYFQVKENFMLVDLPGYGYAAPRGHQELFRDILENRRCIATVCLLINSYAGITEIDRTHINRLEEYRVPYTIILTKADTTRVQALEKIAEDVRQLILSPETHYCFQEFFLTSIPAKYGLNELRTYLAARCKLLKK